MRIAIVSETFLPQVNGVVTILKQAIQQLSGQGHEVLVIGPADAADYPGATIVRLNGIACPFYSELSITPPQRRLYAALQDFRPDVVHAMGTLLLGPATLRAAQQLSVPSIASYQSHFAHYAAHYRLAPLTSATWWYLRRFHNQATLTLCPSSGTRRELLARGFSEVQLWPGGVDTSQFNPSLRSYDWRRRYGIADDTPVILYVGRLAREKNLGLLAEALAGMPGARVLIVGDGPERAALSARLGDQAIFTGYLHGEELGRAYASADLFVFPSLTETFGQVTLEALASGVPAVVTASGAGPDLVHPGLNGLLVPANDADALRGALQALVISGDLRRRMAYAARSTSLSYSWPAVMAQLVAYYQQSIERLAQGRQQGTLRESGFAPAS